jgi:hypothetical protein
MVKRGNHSSRYKPTAIPAKDRFFNYVEFIPFSDCWYWLGALVGGGYGVITLSVDETSKRTKWGKAPIRLAHRFSYELHNGEIIKGQFVLHKCDTPSCDNPRHLFLGTQKENMQDKIKKGRQAFVQGAYHPSAKLNEKEVKQIWELKGKLSQSKIAEKFNTTQTTVSGIHIGKAWNYITGINREQERIKEREREKRRIRKK